MPSRTFRCWPALLALVLWPWATPIRAMEDASSLCVEAARSAAEMTSVPYETLLAISVVETGRDLRPWPWTVNLGGEGNWLVSREEAVRLVDTALGQGLTNIDIGCFQLNYRWHGAAFGSLEDILDPERNALYAARLLASHFERTGDWALAAAAYHSATPDLAERYLARYETTISELGFAPARPGEDAPTRANGFPLLIAGLSGHNGSLVPATSGRFRLLGGP